MQQSDPTLSPVLKCGDDMGEGLGAQFTFSFKVKRAFEWLPSTKLPVLSMAALEQRTCRALSDPAMLSWRPGQGCSGSSPPFSLDQHLGHQLFRNQLLATSHVTTDKKEQQEVRWGLNAEELNQHREGGRGKAEQREPHICVKEGGLQHQRPLTLQFTQHFL